MLLLGMGKHTEFIVTNVLQRQAVTREKTHGSYGCTDNKGEPFKAVFKPDLKGTVTEVRFRKKKIWKTNLENPPSCHVHLFKKGVFLSLISKIPVCHLLLNFLLLKSIQKHIFGTC